MPDAGRKMRDHLASHQMEHTLSDTFILRPATLDDLPALVKHRRGMFVDMEALKGGTLEARDLDAMDAAYAAYARTRLIDGRMCAWVVTAADRAAASGAILFIDWLPRPDGKPTVFVYVHTVYTEPEYRRLGLARRILTAMIAECRARGLPRLTLHASAQGRGLYEQLGFAPTNEMRLVLE
jgi:GNAT superfamily N-acetyltransferase